MSSNRVVNEGDTVDYTLQFANSYDSVDSSYSQFSCGEDGNIAGLDHMFQHTYLRDIPYLKYVEVPITFADTDLCKGYNNIALRIMATCERPTTRSQVYQYEVEYNKSTGTVEIRYDQRRGAENSTFIIDEISWDPSSSSSSSSPSSSSSDGKCNCDTLGSGSEGYYSGYGGGVGGNGGGKAVTSVEVHLYSAY